MVEKEKSQDSRIVLFQGERNLEPGNVELHGGFISEITGRMFGRSLDAVKADWVKVSGQIKEMVESVVPEYPKVVTFCVQLLGVTTQARRCP